MALSKFLDPKNDVAFRQIFGIEAHKHILIHFINDVLELEGNSQIEEVTFISPIQNPVIASKKESIVDVLCTDKSGIQIIVEMQVKPTKGFEKRAQYYAAKAYARQLNKGQEEDGKYYNLKEVVFIAIADYIVFPDKVGFKSDHIVLDKKTNEHDLKDFYFTFIELPKFKKKAIHELETILDKWCYFFKYAEATSEADQATIAASCKAIGDAYEAVNQFNWTPEELAAYEEEVKRIWDNQAALEYQLDKVKNEGMEKGRQEGREEGREEGRHEEKINTAKNMLADHFDIEVIAKITGHSIAQIKALQQ